MDAAKSTTSCAFAINLPSNLVSRVTGAAISIPIVVAAILWFDREILFWVLSAVVAYALWEWSALAGLKFPRVRFIYVIVGFGSIAALQYFNIDISYNAAIACAVCWSLCALAVLFFKQSGVLLKNRAVSLVIGYVICLGALLCIPRLAYSGIALLSLLIVVWLVDSGAYFVGNLVGKHKLHPSVSPNKTWEGMFGGLIVGLICGVVVDMLGWLELKWFVAGWGVVVIAAVFGDLFESAIKRIAQVKDSGTFLPGHGGVLDRVDSILAVLPFVYLLSS